MTHNDAGHYAGKHPSGSRVNQKIAEAVEQKRVDGRITCAAAHEIARNLNVSPAEVGVTLDLLEVRISECQLGLFGYGPQKKVVAPSENVAAELEEAINKAVTNNRISCLTSWQIAEKLGIAKMEVSAACEALKVKISPCQLGSF